jgi:hypothetical protein
MTSDFEGLDGEIIELLKRDAMARRAPEGARERVAVRLVSAGAVGLGASVAGTQALATTSLGSGAAASASGVMAGTTLAGIAKTFILGLGLGASVGVGLHIASNGVSRVAAPHEVTRVAERGSEPRVSEVAPRAARPGSPPLADMASAAALAQQEPFTPAAKRTNPDAARVRSASQAALSVNPAPELPLAPPVASSPLGLAEQQRLLERARAALGAGDARAALGFIREHRAQFPSTAFEEERSFLAIKALVALGRTSEARAQASAFEARFPSSLLLQSLRSALAATERASDSVTGSLAATQSNGVTGGTPR